MKTRKVLFNFFKGKHTLHQMSNALKYFCGKKKQVLNWDPIYISVFPTTKCNLSCDMCLTHSTKKSNPFGQKPTKDMNFEMFKEILNKYNNALAVNLFGNGEPLLNKDLFKMIDYASNVMKMYTFSGSNGIILGDYISDVINSPLSHFVVSINGHNSKEFNRMTGMPIDYFDLICNNIRELVRQKNLKRSNVEIYVSIILDKTNYKYINDMIYFVETLEVNGVLFFQFLPSNTYGFTAEERCLFSDDTEILKIFKQAEDLLSSTKILVTLPPLLERIVNGKFCSVPFYNLSVDGDGNIGGCCCQLLDLSDHGKFYDESAWNNEYFTNFRKRFIDHDLPLLDPCKNCYNNTGHSPLLSNPNPLSVFLHQILGVEPKK